jgi:Zn-dependent protease with chaperone function
MTLSRQIWAELCVAAMLTGLVTHPAAAQAAPPTTASPATTATTEGSTPANGQANAPQQAYTLPADKVAKAIALNRIRNILETAGPVWGIVVLWLLLATKGAARLEGWAQKIASPRWVQGVVFFAALFMITELAGLPLDWIGYHYEGAYGISVQGWGSWVWDQAKALGLTLGLGVPVYLLFNWIVRRWPRRYWLGLWVVTLPILVIVIFALPLVVPLFYTQEPLQKNHAALVAKLETVVARTGTKIPPDRMYLIKASEKSTGINAFVTGIGTTKRFVMWDTATDQLPDDEVLFIFGHEGGHYVLGHIPKEIAGDAVGLLFVYWTCAGFAAWLLKRFGARWGAADLHLADKGQSMGAPGLSSRTGFVVLLFAISIAGFLLEPAGNAFSRHFEHEADVYGQEAVHGLVPDPQKTAVAAFEALGESWLEDPNPNPFIEFWLDSHPSVKQRANFAMHYDPWASGGHGEFFKN